MTTPHEDISVIHHGAALDVIFNRPEKHNALTPQMYDVLAQACRRADADRDIRLLTLRGAGGEAFSAGSDIRHFQTFESVRDGLEYENRFLGVLTELENVRVPTLALINGVCAGAGLLLSAACDVRIATQASRFCLPIARTLGNSLSIYSVALLADRIGSSRLMSLIARAGTMTSDDALQMGFISDCATVDEFANMSARVCDELLAAAPMTIWTVRESLRRIRVRGITDNDDLMSIIYGSDDFKSGVDGFLRGERPVWTGV
ncbi:MAG: enoyl-CoA hydratase [Rhodococcus sp. (in: high G+C Gram-positive bacteria)]|uniref:enoyl-CoA hydratase n=1 Tax=Rhodococcus sp. TaxID=1831 RepID=UPI002AD84D96|nr:enoyl-CoA hydratase [Rhodococcus sp. (in: high G+C Gram-positive bacteria)]